MLINGEEVSVPGSRPQAKKEEREKVEKVTSGTAVIKKKSAAKSLLGNFVSTDANTVRNYIISDVLIPTMKELLADTVKNTVDMFLYGESRGRSSKNTPGSRVSYSSYYKSENKPRSSERTSRNSLEIDDIILETRGEAEDVIDNLIELIDRYGSASCADLYDLVGLDCDYTANKYGWEKLGSACPKRVREGYLLDLPKPIYLG